ncbi:MAG: GH3 family domain-containing protein [Candidatus Helarchaeota archaeon]
MKYLSMIAKLASKYVLKYFGGDNKDPFETQVKLLGKIIQFNQSTIFGKRHHFDEIRNVRDFQKRCKIIDYSYIEPYIEQTINGVDNALTNSKILYWAQTSGTTGKPKLIPITKYLVDMYNSMSLRIIFHYIRKYPERSGFLDGKYFLLPSYPLLRYERDGRPVGFITGIIIQPFGIYYWKKFMVPLYYYPIKYLSITNPQVRFKKIAEDIKGKNITYALGVTSVLINLFDKIREYYNIDKILEILPNFSFTIFSGGSTRKYVERFYEIIGSEIGVREGYFATEGAFGIQKTDRPVMEFVYDSCFYEFVPISNKGMGTERLLINQLEKGKEYLVIITSYNGLYAYNMNDIIKIESIDPVEFKFAYRKGVIDLADEKLTPNEIETAVQTAAKKNNCEYYDYCMVGVFDPKPHYIFIFEFEKKKAYFDYIKFLRDIDMKLQELNEIYFFNIAGPNKGTLIGPELWVAKDGAFLEANERKIEENGNIGQSKIKKHSIDKKILKYFDGLIMAKYQLEYNT